MYTQYVDVAALELVTIEDIRLKYPNISLPDELEQDTLDELGYLILQEEEYPELQPGETAEPGEITIVDGEAKRGWVITPAPEPEAIDWAKVIADTRYWREVSGTYVNGVLVDTDRQSQALATGAAVSAMLDPDYEVNWKAKSGFVTLTATEIIGVAQAIRRHVQSCFDRERDLLVLLENDQFEPSMLEQGWPPLPSGQID